MLQEDMGCETAGTAEVTLETPVGKLLIRADETAIIRLTWLMDGETEESSADIQQSARGANHPARQLLEEAVRQLEAYFDGSLREFNMPLAPAGTRFQQRVWHEMAKIPFGETMTYGQLAEKSQSVARAVGGACGANPIPIIIPCHRVLGGGGKLGGFSGGSGPDSKRALLEHEGVLTPALGF